MHFIGDVPRCNSGALSRPTSSLRRRPTCRRCGYSPRCLPISIRHQPSLHLPIRPTTPCSARYCDLRAVVSSTRIGARLAWLDDRRAAVAEHGHQHPALRSVGILDQPPVLIFLDHAHRQVAALVEPDVGIFRPGPVCVIACPAGDRRPVRRLLFLRGRGRRQQQHRHSRESGNPSFLSFRWVPAFAGMTKC